MRAIVLVQVEQQYRSALTAENLRILPGVISAERVAGPYDVVMTIEGIELEELGHVVNGIQGTAGITRSITMLVLPY